MKKILIADDEVNIRFILREMLSINNYELYEACDGEQALNLSLELNPDIILLDISMPKMTGYEVAKKLLEKNIKSKIIMLSAKAQKSDISTGLNIGADHYITKPFDLNELLGIIHNAIVNV